MRNYRSLLVECHENWLLGNWQTLVALSEHDIQGYPEKAEIASLIAAASLAINDFVKTKYFTSLVIDWGGDKYKLKKLLVASLYNTLACSKILNGHSYGSYKAFEQAVNVEGFSALDTKMLATQRMRHQSRDLKKDCFSFYFPPLESAENNSIAWSDTKIRSFDSTYKPHQIIVLGMHRSGTSCVTNLIKNMGAYFGEEGISTGANIENPKGFWERRDMRKLTDKLLFSVSSDWHKVANFDLKSIPEDIKTEVIQDFNHILADLNQKPIWVLKEPRLSLLIPIFLPLLENPIVVCTYRNPLEVALSLKKRNGFSLVFGLALWEFYTVKMILNTKGLNRIFVSYNEVMKNSTSGVEIIRDAFANHRVNLSPINTNKAKFLIDEKLHRNKLAAYGNLESILSISQYKLYKNLSSSIVPDDLDLSESSVELLKF